VEGLDRLPRVLNVESRVAPAQLKQFLSYNERSDVKITHSNVSDLRSLSHEFSCRTLLEKSQSIHEQKPIAEERQAQSAEQACAIAILEMGNNRLLASCGESRTDDRETSKGISPGGGTAFAPGMRSC
jgi:hypothetical protein